MKTQKIFLVISFLFLVVSLAAAAGDFAWIHDFNVRAEANPLDFRARLAARFNIGGLELNALLSNVEKPADAYIVLRLGEISRHPSDYVLEKYKAHKGKGWGVLAQSLGIKPGSKEFQALKRGSDLYKEGVGAKGKGEEKGKGKGQGKGKGKH
jgi:hypothetical protein